MVKCPQIVGSPYGDQFPNPGISIPNTSPTAGRGLSIGSWVKGSFGGNTLVACGSGDTAVDSVVQKILYADGITAKANGHLSNADLVSGNNPIQTTPIGNLVFYIDEDGAMGTSTSSVAIATGAATFTTNTSFGLTAGTIVNVLSVLSGNSMTGTVTSDTGTALVLNITAINGTGTYASWVIIPQVPVAGSFIPDSLLASGATYATITVVEPTAQELNVAEIVRFGHAEAVIKLASYSATNAIGTCLVQVLGVAPIPGQPASGSGLRTFRCMVNAAQLSSATLSVQNGN